ncbi:DUF7144 family membrane protein [Actinorhabdospora filicis]|uniref:DUF7144 family membrane protein n=1 Tax=Actinorhabdospora filicis TaxID=1785913 RepID=UPI0025571761|nr:hypothetical protein [Actinorhabdospora filicis]
MTSRTARGWAIGGGVLAASVLILTGIWQILTGFAAMNGGDYFVIGSGYTYAFSTTTWGWLHLTIGALMAVVGALILGGAAWARLAGVLRPDLGDPELPVDPLPADLGPHHHRRRRVRHLVPPRHQRRHKPGAVTSSSETDQSARESAVVNPRHRSRIEKRTLEISAGRPAVE